MSPIYHSDLTQRISQAYASMSVSARQVADWLLAHPAEAASLTSVELAERCGVSTATANRFPRLLGYGGFQEFRKAQVEAIGSGLSMSPAQKLDLEHRRDATAAVVMRAGLEEDLLNINRTMEMLGEDACNEAVGMVLQAQRIFCHGAGLSHMLMGLLTYGLEPFCGGNVHNITSSNGLAAVMRKLAYLGEGDLMVLAAFPRYASDTIEIARTLKSHGVKVLAMTDKPTSPLATLADLTLYVNTSRTLLPNSTAGAAAMIDALVGAVANERAIAPGMKMLQASRHFTEIDRPDWKISSCS